MGPKQDFLRVYVHISGRESHQIMLQAEPPSGSSKILQLYQAPIMGKGLLRRAGGMGGPSLLSALRGVDSPPTEWDKNAIKLCFARAVDTWVREPCFSSVHALPSLCLRRSLDGARRSLDGR